MRIKMVLLGDSITEMSFSKGGFGALLTELFARKADVILRGFSGYNTRWVRLALDKAVAGIGGDAESPAFVTVFLGANDAALIDGLSGFQHVPLEEYKENLRFIHTTLKKRWPSAIVIFIAPPPIDEAVRIKVIYGDDPNGKAERTNEAAGEYAKACVAVAEELGIRFIDTWSKMQDTSDWQKFLVDGLHFSELGHKVMFDEIVKTLKDVGVNAEEMFPDLPYYWEVDVDNLAKSLGV